MSSDVRFTPDQRQIKLLETDVPTRREILRAGNQLAAYAQAGAPVRSGRGARSVRGTLSTEDPSASDVSWDRRYYYMGFHESGYRPGGQGHPRRPGRYFLRRAFERYRYV